MQAICFSKISVATKITRHRKKHNPVQMSHTFGARESFTTIILEVGVHPTQREFATKTIN